MEWSRRTVLGGLAGAAAVAGAASLGWRATRERPPNIVLILTDDQGFSDLSCTWQPDPTGAFPRIDTPRIDSLQTDGIRLDTFYVGAAVCTPSRGALLTGCYPPRVGFGDKKEGTGVFDPTSRGGLNPDETTVAELLQGAGYRTACVGKWHLGHHTMHHPDRHGFDDFFGIPYSNNQHPLPLMKNREMLRMLPDKPVLEGLFTAASVGWIDKHAHRPFFLYLAHSAPHWPWNVAPEHRSWGPRGIYGDVIRRLDWSVGEVLDALERNGVADDTLVIFCSDNGPWIDARTGLGGSNHPLRGQKGDTFEGGMRSPFLARWPGVIPAGSRSAEVVTAMDLLPTLAGIAGAGSPALPIDGRDVLPILKGAPGARSPHEFMAYYARGRLEAVRGSRFKLVYPMPERLPPTVAALYDLHEDPGETSDVTADHPDEVARLDAAADRFRAELGDVLRGAEGTAVRQLAFAP